MGSNNKLEVFGEKLFYACRWLISPLCVGLALSLLALVIKFFQESFLPSPISLSDRCLMNLVLHPGYDPGASRLSGERSTTELVKQIWWVVKDLNLRPIG